MFTVWFKLVTGEEKEVKDVIFCGLNPDYQPHPVYFIRNNDGVQFDIPLSSIAYLTFSKERSLGIDTN